MTKYRTVYLSLGSNMGTREDYLSAAINLISQLKRTNIIKKSNQFETEPVGKIEQSNFINSCIKIRTELKPYELLKEINKIEEMLERKRIVRWGPRTIDIDIILYDNLKINRQDLIIPHKEYKKRSFVLNPLIEIIDKKIQIARYLKKSIGEIKKI